MDSYSWFTEEPSIISLSTEVSEEDDSLLDFSNVSNHHLVNNEATMEQMSNNIKRLEKRVRYLERKYVECKKENKMLKSKIQKSTCNEISNDHERPNEQEHNTALIGSHATSLRVIHDLMKILNEPKDQDEKNSSQTSLMDLVRSLHYLSLELVPNRSGEENARRS